jgi:hypothetical protein
MTFESPTDEPPQESLGDGEAEPVPAPTVESAPDPSSSPFPEPAGEKTPFSDPVG